MTDSWRRKRYYKPRVLLETAEVLATPQDQGLYPLTDVQVSIIRNLLQYAHRRATYVSTYEAQTYLAPTTEEWDSIELVVAELEDVLMTSCCEDLIAAIGAINTTLQGQGTTLGAVVDALEAMGADIADIVPPLECLCAKQETILLNVAVTPDWIDYPSATDVFAWGNDNPTTTITSQESTPACELAQAWYQAGFELMTEIVLPALRFGFDKLIPAAAAAISLWTGGAALPVAIGVYATAELIQELLELGYDAAETNLTNWFYTLKQDIVCLLYTGLRTGGTSTSIWNTVQTALVNPSSDISAGDKFLISLVMRSWAPAAAKLAQAQASDWYSSIQTPGYCGSCTDPPIVGSNWVAMPVTSVAGFKEIDHPSGSYWATACWGQNIASGAKIVGIMVQVTHRDAGLDCKWMNGVSAGCPGALAFTDNTSDVMNATGWYYQYAGGTHNNAEVVSTLAPGATSWNHGNMRTGPTTLAQAWQLGWTGTSHIQFYVKYIVYQGTTPPSPPY